MPKVQLTCLVCATSFSRFPSMVRSGPSFCSRACTGKGKTLGLAGTKKRRGETLSCEVCGTAFYRGQSSIKKGRRRFCSEGCRIKAYEAKLIDRTGERPNRKLGKTVTCSICQTPIYRKKSMISRNIDKTCGSLTCISSYARGLWGLPARHAELISLPKHKRKARPTNFTAKQRVEWLDKSCARCGTTQNLTLDHILAVCNGGLSVRENAQTLCGPCNNWKAKYVDRPLAKQIRLSALVS
jgi:hypothetical protein